jgi:hypothetical protein
LTEEHHPAAFYTDILGFVNLSGMPNLLDVAP